MTHTDFVLKVLEGPSFAAGALLERPKLPG